jgi:hypothetical protein
LDRRLVGYLDPFSDEARGLKWPDAESGGTIAYQVRGATTITSDANKQFAALYLPSLANSSYTAPTIVANAVTTWGTQSVCAGFSSIGSAFKQFRIVSWGIRVEYIGDTLTDGGQTTYFKGQAQTIADPCPPLSQGDIANVIVRGRTRDSYLIVSRPLGLNARLFHDVASVAEDLYENWEAIFVHGGSTQASTATMRIEYVYNLELIPNAGDFVSRMASKAAPNLPGVRAAVDNILSDTVGVFKSTAGELAQMGAKAAARGLAQYMWNQYGPAGGDGQNMLIREGRQMMLGYQ